MTALVTINATVAEIEDMLKSGQSVEAVARELQEPRNNVIGVWRAMEKRGEVPTPQTRPFAVPSPAPGPRPTAAPAAPTSGPSVDALAAAAERSSSKRTQALGAKLRDLAEVVRTRLTEERQAAERAEQEKAEREAAAAEVERLEARLREARAKLRRPSSRGGSRPVSRPESKPPLSEAKQQQLAVMREKNKNTEPCANGCGYVAGTKAGKKAHERGSKCPNASKS